MSTFKSYIQNFYYWFIRNKLRIPNYLNKDKKHEYLFILSPPYCGSTLICQILATSNNLSINNNINTMEGQRLPKAKNIMFNKHNRWEEKDIIPWEDIKLIWKKYWDLSKPILLEKSPPNIMRVNELRKVFKPVSFICTVRNPYAQCEGIIRRNNSTVEYAAKLVIKCLRHQRRNIEKEKNILFFSYEELCNNPEKIKNNIISFIPTIEDIKYNIRYNSYLIDLSYF